MRIGDPSQYLREDYGNGVFRRHIAIEIDRNNNVSAILEDEAHAFALEMRNDGERITGFEAYWNRHPTTTCVGAGEELAKLVGCSLSGSPLGLHKQASAVDNCTHFFDLASLMVTHAYRCINQLGDVRRFLYKGEVTDANDGVNQASLSLNGERLLRWELDNGVIQGPEPFAGRHALKGLVGWASDTLSEIDLERTITLQKCFFVSRSRAYRMEELGGIPCKETMQPVGVCYAMRHGREDISARTAMRRDFSDAEEQMLKFVELR